jgi:hypothetical protein
MDNRLPLIPLALLPLLAMPVAAQAQEASAPSIDPYVELRYRVELVDQGGLPYTAAASTLRLRTGVRVKAWEGLSLHVEGEAVARLGPERFNDTLNGKTSYPVVADPGSVHLNQAYVQWRPDAAVELSGGRRSTNLGNQRWIGSVDWRQNDQTLDLARVTLRPRAGMTLDALHSWRVDRVFGPDSPQGVVRDAKVHAAHMSYQAKPLGEVSAYGYWLDLPVLGTRSRTLGVRIAGTRPVGRGFSLTYVLDYARQTDWGHSPVRFDLGYLLVEPGVTRGGWTAKAGLERLDGNGVVAVQTPLATLHAFNGWADKFLTTPTTGLRDLYGELGYRFGAGSPLKGLALRAIYHDFRATVIDRRYGGELDLLAHYPIRPGLSVTAKFARYRADRFATDTTKAWFSVQMGF